MFYFYIQKWGIDSFITQKVIRDWAKHSLWHKSQKNIKNIFLMIWVLLIWALKSYYVHFLSGWKNRVRVSLFRKFKKDLIWCGKLILDHRSEASVTFDNSFFDNYFDFLRQLKNGSFLGPVFIHVTGRSKN
jgi:hypothetical protein